MKTAGKMNDWIVLVSICFLSIIIAYVVAIVWGYFFSFGDFWMDEGYCIDCKMGSYIHCESTTVKDWIQNYPIIAAFEKYDNLKCFLFVEAFFYLLPFLMVSLSASFIKGKKWKNTMVILCGLIIFCFQLLLGYLSYKVRPLGLVSDHILLFGGFGIIIAITYGYVLSRSVNLVSERNTSKFKVLFFAHLLALASSSILLFFVFFSPIYVNVFFFVLLIIIFVIFCLVYVVDMMVGAIVNRIRKKHQKRVGTN